MARGLTKSQNPAQYFKAYVLANIKYWHEVIVTKGGTPTSLNDEGSQIIEALSFAFELETAWPFIYEIIEVLSSDMERQGHWDVWQWVLAKAVTHAYDTQDLNNALIFSALQARLWQRQHKLKQAIQTYHHTIALARQLNNPFREAQACSNLGYLYVDKGYWVRAEVLCCYALTLFRQLGNNHGCAHTQNHLGVLYTFQSRWEEAQTVLEQACETWRTMEDKQGLHYGFSNLGLLYVRMKKPTLALTHLEKALHYAKVTDAESLMGAIYNNMGLAHTLLDDLDTAEKYIWQAKTIFQRYSNLLGIAQVEHSLGIIYAQRQKWDEADTHFNMSLTLWSDLGNKRGEIDVLMDMIECDLGIANKKQANLHLTALTDLIEQSSQDAWTGQIQTRFVSLQSQLK